MNAHIDQNLGFIEFQSLSLPNEAMKELLSDIKQRQPCHLNPSGPSSPPLASSQSHPPISVIWDSVSISRPPHPTPSVVHPQLRSVAHSSPNLQSDKGSSQRY